MRTFLVKQCVLLAMMAAAFSALGQDVEPWKEYGATISSARNIQGLGNKAFGASTSLYTGSTEFSAVDVSIPGNNSLPVQFSRRFPVVDRQGAGMLGGVGDWDIDVPYISGTFSAAYGWVTSAASTPTKFSRCSFPVAPPNGPGQFLSEEIWSGYELHIPGSPNQELTKAIPSAYPMPASGTYPWTTSTTGRIKCGVVLQNGGQGEGFEYVDADGIRYRFDWPIERTIRGLKKPPLGNLSRKKIYLLATQISDRFGNTVSLSYNGDKLSAVNSSDGRALSVAYSNGKVQTVSANGRTWMYAYHSDGSLSQVTNPDSSTWTYTTSGVLASAYIEEILSSVGSAFCPEPGLGQGHFEYTIKHPAGASSKYAFDLKRHYRANVPWRCQREVPSNTIYRFSSGAALDGFEMNAVMSMMSVGFSYATALETLGKQTEQYTSDGSIEADVSESPAFDNLVNTNFFDVFSLTNALVTGPGLNPASTTYSYGSVTTDGFCYPGTPCIDNAGNSPDPDSKWITIVKSNGEKELVRFGVMYGKNEAQQLAIQVESPSTALRRDNFTYVADGEVAALGFAANFGQPLRSDSMLGKVRPIKQATIVQDGATFNRQDTAFDGFARPVATHRWSTGMPGNFSRNDATEYYDHSGKWVLGQVAKQTNTNTNVVTAQTEYEATFGLPWRLYGSGTTALQGKLLATKLYSSDGTLASIKDGNNNVTSLSSWYRGIPRAIQYPATSAAPSGTTQNAVVSAQGWITSVTDEMGSKSCYAYDSLGRITEITYPSETTSEICDESRWNKTTLAFERIAAAEYGIPAGHWRQTISTGDARKITYFDGQWRPLVTREYDAATEAATKRFQRFAYDHEGRITFASYPGISDAPTTGFWTTYDALGRPLSVSQDTELSPALQTTLIQYVSGFQSVTTNPRGFQTVTQYQAFDTPSAEAPTGITKYGLGGAVLSATEIYRDLLGNPTQIRKRSGDGLLAVSRFYVYDSYQQLCKTIEPETGATVMGYDGAGNLTHSWSGLALLDTNSCNRDEAGQSGRLTWRRYTARNQVDALRFPDGRGNQNITYTADGLLDTMTTWNGLGGDGPVVNAYTYNKRRLLIGEAVQQTGWYTWDLGYGYDGNGTLSTTTYPTGLIVNHSPNALGQSTAVTSTDGWTYASGVQYYPNGAVKQFTYGNGIVHTMQQNARQLPSRSTDSGGALDLAYSFDANANVNHIWDYAQDSGNGMYGRWMTYDGLDRLTDAASCTFGGDCWHRFTYDALDNLKSWKLPGIKDYAEYVYGAKNQLTNIKNTAGASIVGLDYDLQGNLANKNGKTYDFDYGNRLRRTDEEWYRYDGHGRRVLNWRFTEPGVLSLYSQSGQLLYDDNYRASGRKATEYVYLAGSAIATRARNIDTNAWTVSFLHTDALGSPVAVTNTAGAVVERTNYEPYGAAINKPAYDGIGYTGHVMDGATGLTYMQQRYYDPQIGRFLSVDPVTAYSNPVGAFNRYWYANNNPYRFTDPDGRQSVGETLDSNALAAADRGSAIATYSWAFAATSWKYLGAEGVSQIADKGWSNTGNGDKAGAAFEIAAVFPPVKILREAGVVGKEVVAAGRATQGAVFATTKEATKAAGEMGFRRVKETVSGQAVYKRGNDYITRDVTGHNGGAWKMAGSVEDLARKETRSGTYSADLKDRIGD